MRSTLPERHLTGHEQRRSVTSPHPLPRLSSPSAATGDDVMTTICATHPRYAEHDYPGHPENAERIRAVWRGLDESGLTARMRMLEAEPVDTAWGVSWRSGAHL